MGDENYRRNKNIVTMLILALFQMWIILISHCIGYPIVLWLFDVDEFFTWRTSMAGLVCILILSFGIFIVLGIGFVCWLILKGIIKQYDEPQVNVICREVDV